MRCSNYCKRRIIEAYYDQVGIPSEKEKHIEVFLSCMKLCEFQQYKDKKN
jgi:hypothetical protein